MRVTHPYHTWHVATVPSITITLSPAPCPAYTHALQPVFYLAWYHHLLSVSLTSPLFPSSLELGLIPLPEVLHGTHHSADAAGTSAWMLGVRLVGLLWCQEGTASSATKWLALGERSEVSSGVWREDRLGRCVVREAGAPFLTCCCCWCLSEVTLESCDLQSGHGGLGRMWELVPGCFGQ